MGQFAFCALLSCGAFDFFFFDLDNAWTGPQHIPDADLYAVGTPAFRIRKSPMSFAESWESGCSISHTNFCLCIENNLFLNTYCINSNSYTLRSTEGTFIYVLMWFSLHFIRMAHTSVHFTTTRRPIFGNRKKRNSLSPYCSHDVGCKCFFPRVCISKCEHWLVVCTLTRSCPAQHQPKIVVSQRITNQTKCGFSANKLIHSFSVVYKLLMPLS